MGRDEGEERRHGDVLQEVEEVRRDVREHGVPDAVQVAVDGPRGPATVLHDGIRPDEAREQRLQQQNLAPPPRLPAGKRSQTPSER